MSHSGSGVVERASKELSRRICSLAAKTRRASTHSTQQKHERLVEQIDTDRDEKSAADLANGNGGWAHKLPKQQGTTRGSGSSSSSSPGTQQPPSQQPSSGNMGISRGIVMDKVTNIFSNCENTIMGNSGAKEKDINGINIPKGAVANGRAKFESSRISTEKPMRFFSRSRPGTPLLPVKAPKVPAPPEPVTPGPVKKRSNSSSNDSSTNLEGLSKLKTSNEVKCLRKPLITAQWLTWAQLSQDTIFLAKLFKYFSTLSDKLVLAQVCKGWREVIYQPRFWKDTRLVVHCRDIRPWSSDSRLQQKKDLYLSIKTRGMEVVCLMHANDTDVFDFIQCCPWAGKCVNTLVLRCCNLTDRGLEALLEFLQGVYSLEINGCNEITEQGLWSALQPRLVSLTITDCINVADECICAITQLLPALYEFNLQAYHVTDSALSYFSPKQTGTMSIMRLQSCWEITNHGLVNIVHSLPNLTVLSLSGCSKITDDGIELIAENLQKLVCLDLSWCPRVTDAALEYIACDLNHLEQLTLDRCVLISDIGVGYVSTIIALKSLFLRWCTQIRDFGLQHVCGMRNINVLSVAGCSQLTSSGLSNLLQLRQLKELELTNCPGSSGELVSYLKQNLPECLIID